MKTKIYLRIGQRKKGGMVVSASSRANYDNLNGTPRYSGKPPTLPTLAFAIEVEFPDELLKSAERVAARINLAAEKAVVCGKVLRPEAK